MRDTGATMSRPVPPLTSQPDPTAGDGRSTPEEIAAAAEALRRGQLVAFPTETVYGLGADAADPVAVGRVFAAKGRPADHPLIVHLASADDVDAWATHVPEAAHRLAEAFWPGPLTMILPRRREVPDAVTGGQPTIGLRVPAHPVAHALLAAFGGGVAAPSANRFGRVSPTTRAHVLDELGDRVGTVLDGGSCEVGLESTIVDLSGDRPRLLRPGGLGADRLAAVLGAEPTRSGTDAPRTPGRLPSHYAPATPVRVLEAGALVSALTPGRRVAVLHRAADALDDVAASDDDGDAVAEVVPVAMPDDPAGYARSLYARLAALDALGCDLAVVLRPPPLPGWEAVHDRLGRAEGVDPHAPRVLTVVEDPTSAPPPTAPGEVDLGIWLAPAGTVRELDGLRVLDGPGRTLHLTAVTPVGPGALRLRLDASDANLGIPVGPLELTTALALTLGPGRPLPRGPR